MELLINHHICSVAVEAWILQAFIESQNISSFSSFVSFNFLQRNMNWLSQISYVLPVQQVVSWTRFCLQLTLPLAHFCYSDLAIFLMLILLTIAPHPGMWEVPGARAEASLDPALLWAVPWGTPSPPAAAPMELLHPTPSQQHWFSLRTVMGTLFKTFEHFFSSLLHIQCRQFF